MAKIDVWLRAPGKDEPPFNPIVNLWLRRCSRDNGKVLLSPDLMSDGEINESVNYLIGQLESVRKSAKKRLSKAKNDLRENSRKRLEERDGER